MNGPAAENQKNPQEVITLIIAATNGNREAFGTLYEQFSTLTLNCLRHRLGDHDDVEDLNHELWARLLTKIGLFDPTQGATFNTWLTRCAYNMTSDYWRARSRRKTYDLDEEFWKLIPDNKSFPVFDNITLMECAKILRHVFRNEQERQIWMYRHIEELPYTDIAALMRLPLGTVKCSLSRVRERIRNRIADKENVKSRA